MTGYLLSHPLVAFTGGHVVLWLMKLAGLLLLAILAICTFGFAATWIVKIATATSTVTPLAAIFWNKLFELGAWVPGRTLGLALVAAFGIITSGFCMKLGRMILSLFTGGGGGAA